MAVVNWTEPALAQLDAIAGFIALDKPEAAKALVQKIFLATDHLARFRRLGRPIPEFRHPHYRQAWIKPCWIYYRTGGPRPCLLHIRRAEKLLRLEDIREG